MKYRLYIGTYTDTRRNTLRSSDGIYHAEWDDQSGELTLTGSTSGLANPSFLALSADRRFLYAVAETADYRNESSGGVYAYVVDSGNGDLRYLNERPSAGAHPCHLSVNAAGTTVLVANYSGATITTFPIAADGSLGEHASLIQFEGSGPDPRRQRGPHAHSIWVAPDQQHVYALDLGTDRVMIYRLQPDSTLTPNDPPFATVAPGAGPRHLAFHPSRKLAYVINEMGNTITGFHIDPRTGGLTEINTVPTVPSGFTGQSTTADIHMHPNGNFLYGSNRGHNSIVVCAIDGHGRLEVRQIESTRGDHPRNFAIDPSGHWLLAANQNTNNIVSFRIDPKSGTLAHAGTAPEVPRPVCLGFS